MAATTDEHKDRVLDALTTAQKEEGVGVWHPDLIGMAAPVDEEDAEMLREAARHLTGTKIMVRGGIAILNPNPPTQ